MTENSKIEWCDATWQVTHGCKKVAAGCANCYAIRDAHRMAGHPNPKISGPRQGLTKWVHRSPNERAFVDWTGVVRTAPENLSIPLRWKKPKRIFVNSNSDLFHEAVPFEFIDQVYAVMLACAALNNRPHRFIILTKRPARMRAYLTSREPKELVRAWARAGDGLVELDDKEVLFSEMVYGRTAREWDRNGVSTGKPHRPWGYLGGTFPLPNVIHGYSAANQPDLDAGIADLLATPSALRCLSLEPLIGPVDVSLHLRGGTIMHMALDIEGALRNRMFKGFTNSDGAPASETDVMAELQRRLAAGERLMPMAKDCVGFDTVDGCPGHEKPGLDWVIVGGESGPGARPCTIGHVREIVQQGKAAGVPVFVKQLGSRPVNREGDPHPLKDRKGADPSEWPADLRVRQWPEVTRG